MASNFKVAGVDLDTKFAKRNWFNGGGSLWTWGTNGFSALGLNSGVSSSLIPSKVGTLTDWYEIQMSDTKAFSIKTDGSLWVWGTLSDSGVSGLNTSTGLFVSSPVQIGSLLNWKYISNYDRHAVSVKTNGTLWGWGEAANGKLGLNSTALARSSPTQIGTLTDWAEVSAGREFTAAVKTNGTLWTWGNGIAGSLGSGVTTSRSSPVQVGALTNWKKVHSFDYHCFALKTDGTIWSWGSNGFGELGLNTTIERSSPVQIGTDTDWKYIDFAVAIKNNGTLWSWGVNTGGLLGLSENFTTRRSSPIQVGTLSNWSSVSRSSSHVVSIKIDGTLWSWGGNFNGSLGIGNTASRSSPTQIGTLDVWRKSNSGLNSSMAIRADGILNI